MLTQRVKDTKQTWFLEVRRNSFTLRWHSRIKREVIYIGEKGYKSVVGNAPQDFCFK